MKILITRFRPYTEVYFFIDHWANEAVETLQGFQSPCWGLFFYQKSFGF